MPTRCITAGCNKTTKDGVSLHMFPADPKYRRLWAAKVRLTRAKWSGPTSFSALCSEHFEPSCFESGMYSTFDMKKKVCLKYDAIPTIFPASGKSKKLPERREEPRGAFAKREKIRVLQDALKPSTSTGPSQDVTVADRPIISQSNSESSSDEKGDEELTSRQETLPDNSRQFHDVGCQTEPIKIMTNPGDKPEEFTELAGEPEEDLEEVPEEELEEPKKSDSPEYIPPTKTCNCGECQAMGTVPESQCCQETDPVRQMTDKFELDIQCILHHPGFSAVCLDTWVLDTAYLQYRQQYGGRGQEATQNKKYRHTAYRQLTRWCWGHLGRMVRVPLPACAVRRIRATFPSEDGLYVGYNEAALDY